MAKTCILFLQQVTNLLEVKTVALIDLKARPSMLFTHQSQKQTRENLLLNFFSVVGKAEGGRVAVSTDCSPMEPSQYIRIYSWMLQGPSQISVLSKLSFIIKVMEWGPCY